MRRNKEIAVTQKKGKGEIVDTIRDYVKFSTGNHPYFLCSDLSQLRNYGLNSDLLQSANTDLFSNMSEVSLALECELEPERQLGKSEEVWLLAFRFVTQEETSRGRCRNQQVATLTPRKNGFYKRHICKEGSSK